MITLHFAGWFTCRLATDPDPHDERRGVSGYTRAYVHEPDLDRVIYWQPPAFTRPLTPAIGVTVRRVVVGDQEQSNHALVGAALQLLDQPKFEGRNGVIAEDGEEPIYPFRVRVQNGGISLERQVVPADAGFPYSELLALGVEGGPAVAAEIRAATGITELRSVWRERRAALEALAGSAAGAERVGLLERLEVLSAWLASPGGPAGFFGVRMRYDYSLRSKPRISGWSESLGAPPDANVPWPIEFWLGGWDADALAGYCSGTLELPTTARGAGPALGMRPDDREPLMTRS